MKSWVMVVCVVAAMLLVGCGGQEEAPTPEEEGRAETTAGETTSATEKTSSAFDRTTPGGRTALPGERAGRATPVGCAGFASRGLAQNYLDNPNSLPAEREALDTDGNGIACDEPGNETGTRTAGADAARIQDGEQASPYDQVALGLRRCQLAEAQRDLGPERFTALQEEFAAEVETADPGDAPSIQQFLAEEGYTCGGRAEEMLGR
jgi:hypothetical protein